MCPRPKHAYSYSLAGKLKDGAATPGPWFKLSNHLTEAIYRTLVVHMCS